MEKVKNKEELLDVSFNAMLLGKSIFAFVEFLSGLLLIFIPLDLIKSTIQHLAASIAFAWFYHLSNVRIFQSWGDSNACLVCG